MPNALPDLEKTTSAELDDQGRDSRSLNVV
jgi:hypothetical protein